MPRVRRALTVRLRRVPVAGGLALRAKRTLETRRFPGSARYWEQHYAAGGDSGPGSRGHLAQYKADFVNRFVQEHRVTSVVELGCGDGAQISLGRYPRYVGLDISATALRSCAARFEGDLTKSFFPYASGAMVDPQGLLTSDLALSMDVLFHLVEQEVFEAYLRDLFSLAQRFVIIYASDCSRDSTVGSVTDRPFTAWVAANVPGWRLDESHENPHAWDGDVSTTTLSQFFVYVPSDHESDGS